MGVCVCLCVCLCMSVYVGIGGFIAAMGSNKTRPFARWVVG